VFDFGDEHAFVRQQYLVFGGGDSSSSTI